MKRRLAALLAAGAALLAGTPRASAHQQPYSYLDLRLGDGGLEGTVAAHVVDLAHEAGGWAPDSLLDSGFLDAHRADLQRLFEARLDLDADGRRVRPQWTEVTLLRERRLVQLAWRAPGTLPGALRVRGPLFPYDPAHETYVNVYERGALRLQDLLDHERRATTFYSGGRQGTLAVVREFVAQGIHHIFIGPDHILFIVGLLLLGGSLGRLLKIVTGFTIAHTVTLALAALQIVNPPARLVEPVIAISIVCIGVETLLAMDRGRDWRARIAFAFGFVHGFGFASVLREFGLPPAAIGWSLASFNVGVEIGQACIVLAVAPLLLLLRTRTPAAARGVTAWGSACIIAAGAYWFVQRVFFTA